MLVRMHSLWVSFREQDEGATMPEYGLMVALIAAVALAGAQAIGVNVLGKFNDVAAAILNAGT